MLAFKGHAVLEWGRELHHAAFGNGLMGVDVADPIAAGWTREGNGLVEVAAIAFLRGRGPWAKVVNQRDKPLRVVERRWREGHLAFDPTQPADEAMPHYVALELPPRSARWVWAPWLVPTIPMARRHSAWYNTDAELERLEKMVVPCPTDADRAAAAWLGAHGGVYAPAWETGVHNARADQHVTPGTDAIRYAAVCCLDGLTASVLPSFPLPQPIPYDVWDGHERALHSRAWRKALRHGGLRRLAQAVLGHGGRTATAWLSTRLAWAPPHDRQAHCPPSLNTGLVALSSLVDAATGYSPEQRVALADALRGERGLQDSLPREAAKRLGAFLALCSPAKAIAALRPKEVDLGHGLSDAHSPLPMALDAGALLLRWSDASRLSDRQRREFPHGIRPGNWSTVVELHDRLVRQASRLEGLAERRPLPGPGMALGPLRGMRRDGLRLVWPRTTATLLRWGKRQGHCVGTNYGRAMAKGQTAILGVFQGRELRLCL
ncbi:MAG: PcfJ domain-containing protein, partial [Bdellovibrionales bacterium]|nr:PcfJ domain-containing protein [Bdellovibrionales bacterium]